MQTEGRQVHSAFKAPGLHFHANSPTELPAVGIWGKAPELCFSPFLCLSFYSPEDEGMKSSEDSPR